MSNRRKISLVFFSIIFLLSGLLLGRELLRARREIEDFLYISDMAYSLETTIDSRKRNIEGLVRENKDCVGWLSIEGTSVDYPIMHTPDNPEKYLRKNFHGNYSVSGVPFMDGSSTLSSDNIIIYGHNMKNGTMFSSLTSYLEEDFSKEHKIVEMELLDEVRRYRLLTTLITDKYDRWYSYFDFDNEKLMEYVSTMGESNSKAFNYRYRGTNKFLTLSTCYGKDRDGRLLIIAEEIE